MPYKIIGNIVYHKKGGKWVKKQTTKSPTAAKKAVKLLRAIDHGWKPTKRKKRRK